MKANSHHHRSGSLVQSNKKHKGEKKRIEKDDSLSFKSKPKNVLLNRKQRRLQAKQLRLNKLKLKKIFMNARGTNKFITCAVIPLMESFDRRLFDVLIRSTDSSCQELKYCDSGCNLVKYYSFGKYKKNLSFVYANFNDIFGCIDLVNISDMVIFITPSNIDELCSTYVSNLLNAMYSQGLPTSMFAVMSNVCDSKEIYKFINANYSVDESKIRRLNSTDDANSLLRHICESQSTKLPIKDALRANVGPSATSQAASRYRSSVLCEAVDIEKEADDMCILKLTGLIRSAPLLLDETMREDMTAEAPGPTIHLSGWGDFKLQSAAWTNDSLGQTKFIWDRNTNHDIEEEVEEEKRAIVAMESEQNLSEADVSDNEDDSSADEYANANTLSDNFNENMELGSDDDEISISSLPSNISEEEKTNMKKHVRKLMGKQDDVIDDAQSIGSWMSKSARTMASTANTAFSEAQLAKFRDARTEEMFPDEVETPRDVLAKHRFAKYRGLVRFRGSEWPLDQDPPLPDEFHRIFCFPNYQRNRRTIVRFILNRYKSILEDDSTTNKNAQPGQIGIMHTPYIYTGSVAQLCIGPMKTSIARSIIKSHETRPLTLWSLLPHERRMSLVHFKMRRVVAAQKAVAKMAEIARKANQVSAKYNYKDTTFEMGEEACTPMQEASKLMTSEFSKDFDLNSDGDNFDALEGDKGGIVLEAEPIRSKEPMLFQCGIRRFVTCPIYSESLNNIREKAKFERYFCASSSATIASMYAPVMYAPQHVLQFRIRADEDEDENIGQPYVGELVATGSLASVDPHRLVIKRILLSGHPYKINKRSAVVRFMFFNPGDIEYFKPIRLQTKWGAIGHIKQSVGTHGYMKCVFDRQMNSSDVVLMPLYKRVLPKWTYEPMVADSLALPRDHRDESVKAMQPRMDILKNFDLIEGPSFKLKSAADLMDSEEQAMFD